MRARIGRSVLLTAGLLAAGYPYVSTAQADHSGSSGPLQTILPGDTCNQQLPPPPSPPPPPPPPSSDVFVVGHRPADVCTHHQPGSSSNDPNANTNPDGTLPSGETDTAACASTCTVSIELTDAQVTITADQVAASQVATQLAAAAEVRGGPVLYVTRDGGGAMPQCPGYRNTFSQWALFGMRHAGGEYMKTGTFTLRHPGSPADARAAAHEVQICFEAPYPFPARPGYGVAEHDGVFDGVLPDCAASGGTPGPCVTHRGIVRDGRGWVARIQFRVPAGPQDPKALG